MSEEEKCDHLDTDTYYHTSESGETTSKIYCISCGMEWG